MAKSNNTMERLEKWQKKAVIRATDLREMRKVLARKNAKIDEKDNEIEKLRKQLKELNSEQTALKEVPAQILKPSIMDDQTRTLSVLLTIKAVISFRSVPRALQIVRPYSWIPHFSSVINWTTRVGLALLNRVKPVEDPWIAMLDMSIDVSKKKFLLCCVSLYQLSVRGAKQLRWRTANA